MTALLQPGARITMQTHPGVPCRVQRLLGAGGQGEVYDVSAGTEAGHLALKWYYPSWATPDQWEALAMLVRRDPPHPSFLWPLDLVTASRPEFGYLMPL